MVRHNLFIFRHNKHLTQFEMAEKTGVCGKTYANIENGKRSGSASFWDNLQKAFDIPDAEMYPLQKLEERKK